MDAGSWPRPGQPNSSEVRALRTGERRRVLAALRRRWPVPAGDWWHPYLALPKPPDMLRLQTSWLTRDLSDDEFRQRAALHWSKFWVIGEGSPRWDDVGRSYQGEYEISPEFLAPVLNSETIVAPTNLDWLAYTDHNDSVFLVGEWLIETVKELWPGWDRHIWTTPFYEHPVGDPRRNRTVPEQISNLYNR